MFKTMIDFTFEHNTKPYIMNQLKYYILSFILPFLVMTLSGLKEDKEMFVAYFVLFGSLSMLIFEAMAITVDPKAYFSDRWNWFDLLQPTLVLMLFSTIYYSYNYDDGYSKLW